jgi:hypothetical protein
MPRLNVHEQTMRSYVFFMTLRDRGSLLSRLQRVISKQAKHFVVYYSCSENGIISVSSLFQCYCYPFEYTDTRKGHSARYEHRLRSTISNESDILRLCHLRRSVRLGSRLR